MDKQLTQKEMMEKYASLLLEPTNAGFNTMVNPHYNRMQHLQSKKLSRNQRMGNSIKNTRRRLTRKEFNIIP